MIFYFSGTGNSLWVASEIAKYQNEQLISIGDEIRNEHNSFEYSVKENEKIGFVFPVYSWAPPAIVLSFIRKMTLHNYNHNYLFFVCSCGDDIGFTQKIFTKTIINKGWKVDVGFSVIMPNNYVIFPGFDTDSKEEEIKKLKESVIVVEHINTMIYDLKRDIFNCKVGSFPFIKSRIINPLFNKYAITSKPFWVSDSCIACKKCQKVCPLGNIIVNGKPSWGKNCTTCLACYHICPKRAIQYGNVTSKKHQYFNPHFKI